MHAPTCIAFYYCYSVSRFSALYQCLFAYAITYLLQTLFLIALCIIYILLHAWTQDNFTISSIYVVLRGWIKSAARYYISDIIIRAKQVLYQLPIKTSGEDSCIATNEANKNFCGGYYRVDDINYLCHIRYGMFPRNISRGPRAPITETYLTAVT